MTILVDWQIKKLSDRDSEYPMISPFVSENIRGKQGDRKVSYGLSSAGYDARLSNEFLVIRDDFREITKESGFLCVKNNEIQEKWRKITANTRYVIKPHEMVLAATEEYFNIPEDVIGIVQGKSTYARAGIVVFVTPLEPGWHGQLTLEIYNSNNVPVALYVGEGICQINFHKFSFAPDVSYKDRAGKYLGQTGVTTSRM